jgi:hypothetical protein
MTMALVGLTGLACGSDPAPEVPDVPPAPAPADVQAAPPPAPVAPPEVEREPLQSLSPTSNVHDAPLMLDGDPNTRWVPRGDAAGEGVLLRFEQPHPLTKARVVGCDGVANRLQLYADGKLVDDGDGPDVSFELPDGLSARSVFVKVTRGDKACIADIELGGPDGAWLLAPPRSVEARVDVSSTLEPKPAYHSSYLFDGRPHFAWVEGAKGSGDGESVQITFSSNQRIVAIDLWNGYQRSDDHFTKNGRVRKLDIDAEGHRVMLDVPPDAGMVTLPLDPPISARVLTLTVAATARGTAYEDMVISEMRFRDREGPFTVRPTPPSDLTDALKKTLVGKPLGEAVGKTFRQVCGLDREMKFRDDHSFVRYERLDESSTAEEVFDGAWVPTKLGAELYGRRHRVEASWTPYGGGEVTATDRVSGGEIAVSTFQALGREGVAEAITRFQKAGASDRVDCLMSGKEPDVEKLKALVSDGAMVLVVEGKAITDILIHQP